MLVIWIDFGRVRDSLDYDWALARWQSSDDIWSSYIVLPQLKGE